MTVPNRGEGKRSARKRLEDQLHLTTKGPTFYVGLFFSPPCDLWSLGGLIWVLSEGQRYFKKPQHL